MKTVIVLLFLLLALMLADEEKRVDELIIINQHPNDERLVDLLELVFNQPMEDFKVMSIPVTVSAYTASVDECDATPHITANQTPSRIGLIAVSRDILDELGIRRGQTVALPPYGVFMVEDVMNERWTRRVDILHVSKKAAKLFGIKKNIQLTWIPWDSKSLITSMNRSLN